MPPSLSRSKSLHRISSKVSVPQPQPETLPFSWSYPSLPWRSPEDMSLQPRSVEAGEAALDQLGEGVAVQPAARAELPEPRPGLGSLAMKMKMFVPKSLVECSTCFGVSEVWRTMNCRSCSNAADCCKSCCCCCWLLAPPPIPPLTRAKERSGEDLFVFSPRNIHSLTHSKCLLYSTKQSIVPAHH